MIDRDKLGATADSEDTTDAAKATLNDAPTPIRHDTFEAHSVRIITSGRS